MKYIRDFIYAILGSSLYGYFLYAPQQEITETIYHPTSILFFVFNVFLMIGMGTLLSKYRPSKSIFKQVAIRGLGMWVFLLLHAYLIGKVIYTSIDPIFIFDIKIKTFILLFAYTSAILVIEYLLIAYQRFNEQHLSFLTYKRKSAQLRLDALKSQLSPHYLFNSLNTVAYLVVENRKKADRYIRSIAETYQFVMRYAQKGLISLEDELQIVRAFAFQLQTRHGKSVKINMDQNMQSIEGKLPPLSVQLLVENAVKHNVLSDDDPVEIDIKYLKEEKEVKVSNNRTTSPKSYTSTKVGLNNLRERYALLSDQEIRIDQDNSSFTVHLPLLH
ncbi:histidine kinase [Flammeovirga yaeyamensis]|uniref:Histidine kinase n=1 Tax=Flammeovirga yaeyamensis TaxID=367791 RepID=A0AAX1NC99_9BACT|nr:histidine kinase [Flammeovirga yaeyamensis]MBB3696989.1 sensor histidine kinase YesM [Flammeovirga yaeyamensis]NMF33652.1 histidine kinase [Flammeovirga yaeyamensis]QWG05082.1 histidine kinase [Flammeovirga yaeyamensis]